MKWQLLKYIEENIKRNNTIRNARIISSERLRKYSEKWNVIFVWLNLIAVIGTVLGIYSYIHKNKIITLVSALFSLYVILVQEFVGKENYSERSLKLHYHQLSLKRVINELTKLKIRIQCTPEHEVNWKDLELYKYILNERNQSLSGYENHDDQDYIEAKIIEKKEKEIYGNGKKIKFWATIDFSVENIQIFIQWIIIITMISYYVFVLLGLDFKWFPYWYLGISVIYIIIKAIIHSIKKNNIKYK